MERQREWSYGDTYDVMVLEEDIALSRRGKELMSALGFGLISIHEHELMSFIVR
jgi:hypothetical protein